MQPGLNLVYYLCFLFHVKQSVTYNTYQVGTRDYLPDLNFSYDRIGLHRRECWKSFPYWGKTTFITRVNPLYRRREIKKNVLIMFVYYLPQAMCIYYLNS
uniref:Uncharacterized protein n=1 Tax=Cacopsylla melanoneura TaxID=428564 RepID=A0A8D9FGH8_9HEMI